MTKLAVVQPVPQSAMDELRERLRGLSNMQIDSWVEAIQRARSLAADVADDESAAPGLRDLARRQNQSLANEVMTISAIRSRA